MLEQIQQKLDELKSDETPGDANAGIEPAENALALVAAMGATLLARNALQAGWEQAFKRQAPKNPASPEVNWKEALVWGAASGAMVGLARIASRRLSSKAYQKIVS